MRLVWVCVWVTLSLIGAPACRNRSGFSCEADGNCDLASGGICITGSSDSACAYPDSACPGEYRYSSNELGDGECVVLTGPGIDAAIDAPQDAAFGVIYGDPWRVAVDATNDGWFLLAANGSINELDLSTIRVVSTSDTHPTAIVRVTAAALTGIVSHGNVAGKIFVDSQATYGQVITETRERTNDGLLTLEILDSPSGDYAYDVNLKLSVNDVEFPLDFKVHHVDSGTTYFSPDLALRKTIYR